MAPATGNGKGKGKGTGSGAESSWHCEPAKLMSRGGTFDRLERGCEGGLRVIRIKIQSASELRTEVKNVMNAPRVATGRQSASVVLSFRDSGHSHV
jgi:hypothetical protein